MKKGLVIMLLIVSVFFVSGCENKYERKIWGTWKNVDVHIIYKKTLISIITYNIKKDGTYTYTLNFDDENLQESTGTYKIKKNIITLKSNKNKKDIKIFEYDENKDILFSLENDIRTGEIYKR